MELEPSVIRRPEWLKIKLNTSEDCTEHGSGYTASQLPAHVSAVDRDPSVILGEPFAAEVWSERVWSWAIGTQFSGSELSRNDGVRITDLRQTGRADSLSALRLLSRDWGLLENNRCSDGS